MNYSDLKLHRNSQKRFYGPNKIYYIVTKTHKNFPFFENDLFCDLFIEELQLCKKLKQFKLCAFSIIHDHLNLLIKPGNEFNISQVMKSIKENFSRDANKIILNAHLEHEGDTSTCRLHVRKVIVECQERFLQKHGSNQITIPKFKWQKSFRDHVIRNRDDFWRHYNYTIYNHRKHGLPENWQYTSLRKTLYKDLIDKIDL